MKLTDTPDIPVPNANITPADLGRLGESLRQNGQITEAIISLEKAIAMAPRVPHYYRILLRTRQLRPGEDLLRQMEQLAADSRGLTDYERAELGFALGKAYQDLGDPKRAFDNILAANQLIRRQIPYDEKATFSAFATMKQAFSAEILARWRGYGDPSTSPIFVVGMPRSGSTLVEQILASHSQVWGAGETDFLAQAMKDKDGNWRWASIPGDFDEASLRGAADTYLGALHSVAPMGKPHIVDKLLGNFMFLGFINILLPNARIIHVRRDPIDTCLSCFANLFERNLLFTYDLDELRRYYLAYRDIMEHWRCQLPSGVMIEISYEDLIANPTAHIARLLDHCGLAWQDSCLDFHQTERQVLTASANQVRAPINRDGLERWKAFRPFVQDSLRGL